MKILRVVNYAMFGLMVMLAACGSPNQLGAPTTRQNLPSSAVGTPRHHQSVTFQYAGAQQSFMVPTGVTQVTVRVYGGSSGSIAGGYVKATIMVTPGESLAVFVGGNGYTGGAGFNGGGSNGGAGASDLRQGGNALGNRVVVAGGAGGDGDSGDPFGGGAGGAGGGLAGGNGSTAQDGGGGGGGGGTQNTGGGGGSGCRIGFNMYGRGGVGALGVGGAGGSSSECHGPTGGGGGGGYYGGGGGGAGHPNGIDVAGGGGGGGGSSYAEPSALHVTNQQGGSARGLIIISW